MPRIEYFLSEINQTCLPDNVFFGDIVYGSGKTHGPRLQANYQPLFIHSVRAVIELRVT